MTHPAQGEPGGAVPASMGRDDVARWMRDLLFPSETAHHYFGDGYRKQADAVIALVEAKVREALTPWVDVSNVPDSWRASQIEATVARVMGGAL